MIEWTLPLLNRIRGGLPIFFGREVTKGIPTLAMAVIISLPFWGQWWLFALSLAFAVWGLVMSHGQWFPGRNFSQIISDPDKDTFYDLFIYLHPEIGTQWARFICMSMTGLTTTLGLALAYLYTGEFKMSLLAAVIGFSKGIAYELGHRTPSNIKHFKGVIELGEVWFGLFLAVLISC